MSRTLKASRLLARGAVVIALALTASACGGSNNGGTAIPPVVTPPPPPVTVACDTFLEQFGLGFCQKFKAAANSEPTEVQSTDIVPVDVTKEPVAVP